MSLVGLRAWLIAGQAVLLASSIDQHLDRGRLHLEDTCSSCSGAGAERHDTLQPCVSVHTVAAIDKDRSQLTPCAFEAASSVLHVYASPQITCTSSIYCRVIMTGCESQVSLSAIEVLGRDQK